MAAYVRWVHGRVEHEQRQRTRRAHSDNVHKPRCDAREEIASETQTRDVTVIGCLQSVDLRSHNKEACREICPK